MNLPEEVKTILSNNSIEVESINEQLVKIKGQNCPIRIGKLLARYIKNSSKVKELVTLTKALNADISAYEVKYITEADGYVSTYQIPLSAINSSGTSCMTNSESVQVYAYDSRLKLLTVYFENQLVGRTLVRTDDNTYIRMYLNNTILSESTFLQILLNEGFNISGSLNGIELDYVTNSNGYTLCPYLDGGVSRVTITYNCLTISDYGEVSATSTDGILEILHCDHCGCHLSEDNVQYTDCDCLCESCFDDNYIYWNGEVYSKDDCVTTVDGEVIPLTEAKNNYTFCDSDNEWYPEGDARIVYINEEYVLIEDCVELVIPNESDNDNQYALECDAIYVKEVPLFNADFVEGWYLQEQIDEIINNYLENEDE